MLAVMGLERLTRRQTLGTAAALGAASLVPSAARGWMDPPLHRRRRHPLPSPHQVRRDFQRMVDFGPRLTGSAAHNRYIAWLEREFTKAGCHLKPCDVYKTERWLMKDFGLDILEGSHRGRVNVATYYPRSAETKARGVEGPLVYGGTAPAPSISPGSLAELPTALAQWANDLSSWAGGLTGTIGGLDGSILLVDLPLPAPITVAAFLPISTFRYWPGHNDSDWAASDYKRLWIEPGLGVPLAPFQGQGAKGVVFIVDSSHKALKGGYLPFTHGFEPLPALYVDRDTGQKLRNIAGSRPKTRLKLTASHKTAPTPSVTAVLPGKSKETLIFNTHTDGQGFVEENAGVAFVQLARYFGSLPTKKRLKRTIVFAAWPGHMVADLPQTQGWIDAHPGLVKRAAAALTVEHLGCSEWTDTIGAGYHPTGENEMFGIWTSQGKMFELTRDTIVKHDIARTSLLRPPVQFGVGAAFQSVGVPQIGAIAGPQYLLTVSKNGDMDKLDAKLASKQIRWLADLARKLDDVSAAELRAGDPTLGSFTPGEDSSKPKRCGPR